MWDGVVRCAVAALIHAVAVEIPVIPRYDYKDLQKCF